MPQSAQSAQRTQRTPDPRSALSFSVVSVAGVSKKGNGEVIFSLLDSFSEEFPTSCSLLRSLANEENPARSVGQCPLLNIRFFSGNATKKYGRSVKQTEHRHLIPERPYVLHYQVSTLSQEKSRKRPIA